MRSLALKSEQASSLGRPRVTAHVRLGPEIALSDAELAERVARGDRWAEEAVYRRFVPEMLGTARRLLAHTQDAEDVVQDAFATAFEIWGQLRDPARVRQWLMQIAVRKVHRRFRRRKLLRALGLDRSPDDATLESLAHPQAGPELRADLARLDRILMSLPAAQRIAWMLRYVEGCALEEVACECGCSLATAKRRISTAHAVIADQLRLGDADV